MVEIISAGLSQCFQWPEPLHITNLQMLADLVIYNSKYVTTYKLYKIFLLTSDEELIEEVTIESFATVLDLKNKIFDKIQIPVEYQELIFHDINLEDSKDIEEYEINDNSRIILTFKPEIDPLDIDLPEDTKVKPKKKTIFLKKMDGKCITLSIDNNIKIAKLKLMVQEAVNIEPIHQILIFGSKQLTKGTIKDYGIKENSIIHLCCIYAGGNIITIDPCLLSPEYDYDFTNIKDSCSFSRGNMQYKRPCGWKRYALNVVGKYDGGDDTWLGSCNQEGEWAVAYHGTKECCVKQIVANGLKHGTNNVYGVGVYCTPNISTARGYTSPFTFKGENYRLVIQTRVDPKEIFYCQINGGPEDYWVMKNESKIRPYGICIQKS